MTIELYGCSFMEFPPVIVLLYGSKATQFATL
jgi:hypothetical protein